MAGQSDRSAFCDVLQRQLYAILGEEEPPCTEHTRDEQLLTAWERAAHHCASRRQRLVVLVDGLDEDRGVVAGPDSYSIAAILPVHPPHGSRVLVAGRPHPPVPDDVPFDHPLRVEATTHRLDVSEHAEAVRRDAEADLLRLLQEEGLARELVGLISAAGGGLSTKDLAHLSQTSPRMVSRHLSAATGRVFRTSSPHWAAPQQDNGAGEELYLLGHEELQQTALELLSPIELASFRQRLHAWADHYDELQWPHDSPEYLLRGYGRLLQDNAETERLVRLATNRNRHMRLRHAAGTDREALSEISFAFELILADSRTSAPNLHNAISLAVCRDSLHDSNRNLPKNLLTLWARLGLTERATNHAFAQRTPDLKADALIAIAEALVREGERNKGLAVLDEAATLLDDIFEDDIRAEILAKIAHTLIGAGSVSQALKLIDDAINLARKIADPGLQEEPLAAIIEALMRVGEYRRAISVSGSYLKEDRQAYALSKIVKFLAGDRRWDQALDLAHTITRPQQKTYALMHICLSLTEAGCKAQVGQLMGDAIRSAQSLADPSRRAHTLARLSRAFAKMGEHSRATEVANEAYEASHAIRDAKSKAFAQADIAESLAFAGHHNRAIATARNLPPDSWAGIALSSITGILAEAGLHDDALRLAETIIEPPQRGRAISHVAKFLAEAGEHEKAISTARRIADARTRMGALCSVAWATANEGSDNLALQLAEEATTLGQSIRDLTDYISALCRLAELLAEGGLTDTSLSLTEELKSLTANSEPYWQDMAHVSSARVAALAGRHEACLSHIASITDAYSRMCSLTENAITLAQQGNNGQAKKMATEAISLSRERGPMECAIGIAEAAQALRQAGEIDDSTTLFDEATTLARNLSDPGERAMAFCYAAQNLAHSEIHDSAAKLTDEAVLLAREIRDIGLQEHIFKHAGEIYCTLGEHVKAKSLPALIGDPEVHAETTIFTLHMLARAGKHKLATELAQTITQPDVRLRSASVLAATAGESVAARRALTEALRVNRWQETVKEIACVGVEYLATCASQVRHVACASPPENPPGPARR
ncbi:hypothetical protein AB0J57_09055 [Streptomyces sp. NPDC049837]|uniref:hypothetical protein n=1 Tax=Streptomyces sp. NPDC049837 TaxID=3155277 RepID=UPI00342B1F17